MARSVRTWFAVSVALFSGVVAACASGAPGGSGSAPSGAAVAGKPQVVIQSPPANAQVALGQPVDVVTTGVDATGVGRIDLKVNDFTISSAEAPPGGLTSFSAVHVWTPSTAGPATLTVVAYRTDGAPSDPMTISVLVLPSGATAAPYPTYAAAVPPYRASAVPGNYAEPTYKANPTYGATPTYAVGATATAYADATPTDYVGATPTYAVNATPTYAVDATPTYVAGATPTYAVDATPTYEATATYYAEPTSRVAPPDATYTMVMAFNGASTELSDYVSYPAGDVEDRVDYDISGMSAFPPGNLATLQIFAVCEGTGQDNIEFRVGPLVFHCGDQLINKTVNYDGRTGSIRIVAVDDAYVKWTLVGSAFTPLN